MIGCTSYVYKMNFLKIAETKEIEELNRSRIEKMQVFYEYEKLYENYEIRKISLLDNFDSDRLLTCSA